MRRARLYCTRLYAMVYIRLCSTRAQGVMEYFLLVSAVALLAGDAVFTFGGAVGHSMCTATYTLTSGTQGCS